MASWTSQRTGTWSDDAANASSPWNGGGNPASGIPANTDTVTIAVSHTVTFDVDQSGFAAGITLTINGTLTASTSAGSYILKMQANMTGSGTLRAGTSGTPYPTNCTFEIQRGGFQITTTNMTLDLNCSEPTTKYIRLSAQEAIGQTILSVDTDVTGETAYWKDAALIRINDVNFGVESEERTIAAGGVAATTITVTAGLTAQKESGTIVALVSRNVKITHSAATGSALFGGTGGTIAAEIRNGANGVSTRATATINGTISGCTTGLSAVNGCTINAIVVGCTSAVASGSGNVVTSTSLISGCTQGFNVVTGTLLQGLVSGCTSGVGAGGGFTITGTIKHCTNGINTGGGHKIYNATLENTIDILNAVDMTFYNTLLAGTTENSGYNGTSVSITTFVESVNHDQTANQYRAWTKGGIVDSDTGTVYTGRTRSYKHACASASFYVFQNRTFTVQPGGGLVVQCYVRKSALMTYLPRVWILTPGQEPFVSGSPNAEDIMTDSVDTWEELNLVYANGGTSPVDVVVRTLAKNASGNVYFDPIVTVLAPVTYDVYNTLQATMNTIERKVDDNQALIIAT